MRERKVRFVSEVPFCDVDSLGVVWHGRYLNYFELARTALFRQVGFDIKEMTRSGYVWPVIEAHCRYLSPLQYGDRFAVDARFADIQHRVKIEYTVTGPGGRRVAKGHTVQAAVRAKTGTLVLNTPDVLLHHLSLWKEGTLPKSINKSPRTPLSQRGDPPKLRLKRRRGQRI
ncbi:MAG: acyl-CoA thioesterase [Elusimicrobia bacterium]|nr:acyl-CoA thioesterase [Elusimicrobiota bacterium]